MRSADDSKPVNGTSAAGGATTPVPLDTGQPTERHLMTVIKSRRGEDRVPHICMSGKWLARAGFASGSRIAVEATAGKLVITPSSRLPVRCRRGRARRLHRGRGSPRGD